jgi:hypothetical protein
MKYQGETINTMRENNWIHINLHILLPIFLGASIYLLFRKDTLLVFSWIDYVGASDIVFFMRDNVCFIHKYIPDFVLYSLPNAIWVYSGTVALIIIWKKYPNNSFSFLWVSLLFIYAIVAEIMQLIGIVKGTFCTVDIVSSILFFCLALRFYVKRRLLWIEKF